MKKPLFKFLFGIIAAVLLADQFTLSIQALALIFILIILLALTQILTRSTYLTLFIICITSFELHQFQKYHPNEINSSSLSTFRIVSNIEEKKNVYRVLTIVNYQNPKLSLDDYCWLYFSKEDTMIPYIHKDGFIQSKNTIIQPSAENLPETQFDYISYQKRKRIFYTSFLKTNNYQFISTHSYRPSIIDKLHHFLSSAITKAMNHPSNASMATSLILGDRATIDQEVIDAYSKIGIIHLLSVSGLHVGIFILLINTVFKKSKSKNKYLKFSIMVSFLIFYTLITGVSIPVLRCAVMFGFIEFGKLFRRESQILNSLAVSAIFLLLFNTQFLFDIGFQLSYLALAGIVILMPKIKSKIYFQSKIMNIIWDLCSSTIAAWIITFPLVAYYFHNVSLLGNLANIFAIPLAALILYSGLSLIIFSFNNTLLIIHGKILNWLLNVLNTIVDFFYYVPISYFDGVYISRWSMLLAYLCLFGLISYLWYKKNYMLKLGMLAMVVLNMNLLIEHQSLINKKFMSYYFVNNAQLFLLKENNKIYYSCNKYDTHINCFLKEQQRYYHIDSISINPHKYFKFDHKKFAILNDELLKIDSIDYLICFTQKVYLVQKQLENTIIRKGILFHSNKLENEIKRNNEMYLKINRIKLMNASKFVKIEF